MTKSDREQAINEGLRRIHLDQEQRKREGLKAMNYRFRGDVLELLSTHGLLDEASRFSACSSVPRPDGSPRSYCRLPICRRCNRREAVERFNGYYERLVEYVISLPSDTPERRSYAATLKFAPPYVISSEFISRVRDSVSLFLRRAFVSPSSPAVDAGAGVISSISLLSRSMPQSFRPHAHLLVHCKPVSQKKRKALRRIWRSVFEEVFHVPARRRCLYWREIERRDPKDDPILAYLAYIVKPEVYLNPQLAVDVLRALSPQKTDDIGRCESAFRRSQLRGVFSLRGVRHG